MMFIKKVFNMIRGHGRLVSNVVSTVQEDGASELIVNFMIQIIWGCGGNDGLFRRK